MNAADVTFAWDESLPDSKIISDLRAALEAGSIDGFISIELETPENDNTGRETEWTPVPIDASLQIVMKKFTKDDTDAKTDVKYWVTVAIGEFQFMSTGSHKAGYCFVKLVYNDKRVLVTQDFRREYIP